MNVLDATFLIDYLAGVETTREFYEEHGGGAIRWVVPVPAFAEPLVGEGNLPSGDVDGARADLAGSTFVRSTSERPSRQATSRTRSRRTAPTWTGSTR